MTPDMVLRWRKHGKVNPFVSYSGAYTMSEITDSAGTPYILYTLTGSGELVLAGDVQYWMCGGGAGGQKGSTTTNSSTKDSYYYAGTGGGGGYIFSGVLDKGEYTIAIGIGGGSNTNGGATTLTKNAVQISTADGGKYTGAGGSGGGGKGATFEDAVYIDLDSGGYWNYDRSSRTFSGGTGKGASTAPFDIASLKYHCAGGGGGSTYSNASTGGGTGGTNGASGASSAAKGSYVKHIAPGGDYGGGTGACGSLTAAGNASFYGSGGGGGGVAYGDYVAGGAGYQGVAYVLVPAA